MCEAGAAGALPAGTVTFLFTDLEGSTALLEAHPAAYRDAVARHHDLLRGAVTGHGGVVFETVGDAVYAAFAHPTAAVAAALAGQRALQAEPWGATGPLRVRMGVHLGEVERQGAHYFGAALYRCARLMGTAHGGQVVLSEAAVALVRDALPEGAGLRDLGEHRLKDLQHPERVFQLAAPGLPGDFPALRTLDALPHNLPLQLTSFVGRERELGEVAALLGAQRLVTLTGPGGTGKTRLALQAAADALERYPDGVWLAELAALADPGLVPQAVAAAVGVREEPGRPLPATLADALRPKRLLLLLDNCEHVLDAGARLADALLRACPHVRLLCTSREALGIAGETVWRVPSLPVPAVGDGEGGAPPAAPDAGGLTRYAAVRLFCERAAAVRPGFALTADNAPAVAQVCVRLDGIPLAIELAAARVRVLPPRQLLARLEDRFRLLTGGSRTALERHQTLQAAVAWSHALLTAPERTLFARLSVFAGGFSLEAAEAVGTDPDGPGGEGTESPEVLDLLTHLVDTSLVEAEEQPDGTARYRLLETLRQYARERLEEAGEAARVRTRHAAYFAGEWGARAPAGAASALWGPGGADAARAWHEQTDREYANLRAALRWFADTGGVEPGLRLCLALHAYWFRHAALSEGAGWYRAFLAADAARRAAPAELRARVLDAAGIFAQLLGDYDASTRLRAESVETWRAVGAPRPLTGALIALGADRWLHGEYARAEAVVQEALEAARRLGDAWSVCRCLRLLAQVARVRRDFDRAAALLEESLTVAGDTAPLHAYRAHCLLGRIASERGRYREATAHLAAGVALISAQGSPHYLADGLEWLAAVAGATDRAARAARLLGAAATVRHETGEVRYPPDRAAYERDLASVRAQLDDVAFAAAWAQGQAMSLEQAVAYALADAPDAA
jgi:predicted ATPase/class 3 adenylate cyclase